MLEDVLLTKRIIALLAYIFGFAAVPIFAKTFSGALGQLLGMVNDKSKGLIDRPRNKLRDFSTGRREGRKLAKQVRRDERAGPQKPLEKFDPRKAKSWQDAWKNRHKARNQLQAGWNAYKAGGRMPNPRRLLREGDKEYDKKMKKINESDAAVRAAATGLFGAAGRHMDERRAVANIAGQGAFDAMKERQEKLGARAKMALFGNSMEELEAIVRAKEIKTDAKGDKYEVDAATPEPLHVRMAAFSKLCEAGMDTNVRTIISDAVNAQAVNENDPLVSIVKNSRNNDELFKGFREKAPDIAKGLFDDEGKIKVMSYPKEEGEKEARPILTADGKLQAGPTVRFLYENSAEDIGTKWGASSVEHVSRLPDDYEGSIGGRKMNGQEIKQHILVSQSREIFMSPQLRRKSNQATIETLAKEIYESDDLWNATDDRYKTEIINTLNQRNLMGAVSKQRPWKIRTIRKLPDPEYDDELDSSFLDNPEDDK
ncbi:hypothetical protein F4X86_03780 [Candidatus Saccharibacteria bacterium]|nr:hypothetical protein [Candidatus Saccharibacteria bacterium]